MEERILVIEDDVDLGSLIQIQLERAGYRVAVCLNGPSGLQKARELDPDLILLDILLPEMDGWAVCKRIQEITDAPIIFTTALGAEHDMVQGLELGADDYMIKPFSNKELLSRVKSALHRAQRVPSQREIYESERLFVDLEAHIVKVDGERIPLTPLEYDLLAVLIREVGNVVPHATLLRQVWGPEHEDQREYLKLYVWYLRQKIEADPSHPTLILTERGIGYRLAEPGQT